VTHAIKIGSLFSMFFVIVFLVFALTMCSGNDDVNGGLFHNRSGDELDDDDDDDDNALGDIIGNFPDADFATVLFGTQKADYVYDSDNDSEGNVLIAGSSYASFLDGEIINSGSAIFAKYNPSGEKLWLKQYSNCNGTAIKVDRSDNSVYAMISSSRSLFGYSSLGSTDVYLIKFDSGGELIWTYQIATTNDDTGSVLAIDASGNVYVGGHTRGDIAGSGVIGDYDLFIMKLSDQGLFLASIQFGSDTTDISTGIDVDSLGNVYLTGRTSGDLAAVNQGLYDYFLAKYDSSLNQIWVKQNGVDKNDKSNTIAIDSNDNIYIAGSTYHDLSGEGFSLGYDVFLAKYNTAGDLQWIKQKDSGAADLGSDIVVGSNGKIYVTGITYGNLAEDAHQGEGDAFLLRFDPSGELDLTVQFGTPLQDEARTVTANGADDIFISGFSRGNFDAIENNGDYDFFIISYASP